MRIEQLLEFQKEDFNQMSRQATNIQQARNADLARSTQPEPVVTQTAPEPTTPVNLTATPQNDLGNERPGSDQQAQQQNAPMDPTLAQHLPGQPAPKKSFAQTVGGLAKGVGAVAGGVAGIGRAIKKGYNAGANAVGGPGYAQPGPAGSNAGGGSGGGAGGGVNYDDEIANLKSTIQQMDQRLRRVGAE